MAAVVLATIVITWQMGLVRLRSEEALDREQDAIESLREVLSTVKDAETGQRGYLLTGDKEFVKPYDQSAARIGTEIKRLESFVDSGELQRSDVIELKRLIDEKLAE